MSELEEKLSAVLNNPQLMQQIMSIAQTMGSTSEQQSPQTQESSNPLPSPDPKILQALIGQNNVDNNQKALLHALAPYLSRNRVAKLERAMRAARMAGTASRFLSAGGLQMLTGR